MRPSEPGGQPVDTDYLLAIARRLERDGASAAGTEVRRAVAELRRAGLGRQR